MEAILFVFIIYPRMGIQHARSVIMKIVKIILITMFLSFSLSNSVVAKTSSKEIVSEQKEAISETVNINKAEAKEIAKVLKGVGLKKAQAIVNYRKKHGSFKAIEEVASVKGIGVATVAKNHSKIRLK